MQQGQKLYEHAKKVIPGGTQLLSKRPEMFLPGLWPAYYKKAKGCKVWDLDEREYYDCSYMGIGANVLGYAYDEVDNAAKEAIDKSSMCTLNAPEEVYLADKLIQLHPWAHSVRYAKTGGEAMSIAVRIARAYTKKDVILFCGYHGWHDWYLSANLKSQNALNGHHISGLEPNGVPSGLVDTSIPFHYNNIDEFKMVFQKYRHRIAAVVMEPIRNEYPTDSFLKTIRNVTTENNIVLIFDEITAGFRLCVGGSHKVLGVSPDIAVFAKGISNGYPLAAIIGKQTIMDSAQDTFISSTYFTERVALAAALKNIEIYEKKEVWKKQIQLGKEIKKTWENAAAKYNLKILVSGIDPLPHFDFLYPNANECKTFFIQEMLKKGFLASTAFYVSYSHSKEVIEKYSNEVDNVFEKLSFYIEKNKLSNYIETSICQSGFERLN